MMKLKQLTRQFKVLKILLLNVFQDNPKYRQRLLKDVYYQGNIVTTKEKKQMMKKRIFVCTMIMWSLLRIVNHRI